MRGFPKHLNTRFDVEYCLKYYPEETKTYLAQELTQVKNWLMTRKLKKGEAGITDKTHKVVEIEDLTTGKVAERYQYEYKDDPNCWLFRLGFTAKEAKKLLSR